MMTLGFNVLYFPMLIMGYMGMPRRYYHYLHSMKHFIALQRLVHGYGRLVFLFSLSISSRVEIRGAKAPANPWGGATLEWTVSSPPPTENFHEIPVVTKGPYDYSE